MSVGSSDKTQLVSIEDTDFDIDITILVYSPSS